MVLRLVLLNILLSVEVDKTKTRRCSTVWINSSKPVKIGLNKQYKILWDGVAITNRETRVFNYKIKEQSGITWNISEHCKNVVENVGERRRSNWGWAGTMFPQRILNRGRSNILRKRIPHSNWNFFSNTTFKYHILGEELIFWLQINFLWK